MLSKPRFGLWVKRHESSHPLCQFSEVRALPINLSACGAETIVIVVVQRAGFCSESIGHVLFARILEQSVAFETAREGSDRA